MWQLKATPPSSLSSRKNETFSPDWSCTAFGARHSTLCSHCSEEEVPSLSVLDSTPSSHSGLFGQPYLHMSPESINIDETPVKAPRQPAEKLPCPLFSKVRRRHLRVRKHHQKKLRWRWRTKSVAVAEWTSEANVGGQHATKTQYLDSSEGMKIEIEVLEYCLLGPEESEVDISHTVTNARVIVSSW